MLLTLTTTHNPATDLGFLLHKHPEKVQRFSLNFGEAVVFYPEVGPDRCTCALLLEVDPVPLTRAKPGQSGPTEHYVNDRGYVASSFLSVALAVVFRTALQGTRPELAAQPIPLEATLAALPCRGGEGLLRGLFEPLGYQVELRDLGAGRYFQVTLRATVRLSQLLAHLYVLVPVTDDEKHYWIGDDEVDKLLRRGQDWLTEHPLREQIVRRYLKHQRGLARAALERLAPAEEAAVLDAEEEKLEKPLSLHDQRLGAVVAALKAAGARRVLDLGCGEGRLLRLLLADKAFAEIVGMDVSARALERARQRLNWDRLSEARRKRVSLLTGSLLYRDQRLAGYDGAALVEVIEHLEPDRLASLERAVFEFAKPETVVVTTPNREYNVRFETLPEGRLRHQDHRFEWTRAEFAAWAARIGERWSYTPRIEPVGPLDPELGAPTQMAVFTR